MMDEIIFPYELNDDYYSRVGDFGDEFFKYCQKFNFENDEESLEALCIGVYWYLYGTTALDLNSNIPGNGSYAFLTRFTISLKSFSLITTSYLPVTVPNVIVSVNPE